MKYYLCFFLLYSTIISAQQRDTRADLKFNGGGISKITVSPKGRIWIISTLNNLYYSESIMSAWHHCNNLNNNDYSRKQKVNVRSIRFFNNDTAIVEGHIYNIKGGMEDVFYWTGNNGKNWKELKLNDVGKILEVTNTGNAWANDCSGNMYVSHDHGLTWTIQGNAQDYKNFRSIAMSDSTYGYAISGQNKIYKTTSGWKSYDTVTTPLDMKTYIPGEFENYIGRYEVTKAYAWGEYLVVTQCNRVFYTNKNVIGWKKFPLDIIEFEPDAENKPLFCFTSSLSTMLFSSPEEYTLFNAGKLKNVGLRNITVFNHSLYSFDNRLAIYEIHKDTVYHQKCYTTDYPIERPDVVKPIANKLAGVNDKSRNTSSLYFSDDNGINWYREIDAEFPIIDFSAFNDSTLLLWNGERNYCYNIISHTIKDYSIERPFDQFLKYPIKTISMQLTCYGHSYGIGDNIIYSKDADDDSFAVSVFKKAVTYPRVPSKSDTPPVSRSKIFSAPLLSRLAFINQHPDHLPQIDDFEISDLDKKSYLALVSARQKQHPDICTGNKIDTAFYNHIIDNLDTISSATVKQAMSWIRCGSMTGCKFDVTISNGNNEILNFTNTTDYQPTPWQLPWTCTYKETTFHCYDAGLSAFVKYCKPPIYKAEEVYSNPYLLMRIADYLFNR